jgi:hypothetical protein
LKELEQENTRLKRAVADLTLDVRRQRKWESELGIFSGELVTLRLGYERS